MTGAERGSRSPWETEAGRTRPSRTPPTRTGPQTGTRLRGRTAHGRRRRPAHQSGTRPATMANAERTPTGSARPAATADTALNQALPSTPRATERARLRSRLEGDRLSRVRAQHSNVGRPTARGFPPRPAGSRPIRVKKSARPPAAEADEIDEH